MRQSYKDYDETQAVQNVLIINLEKINTNINAIINIRKVEKINAIAAKERNPIKIRCFRKMDNLINT